MSHAKAEMAHVFLLVFSRVYKVCSYTKSIHGNNHEKMVNKSMRCCKALCTKGFRIRENSVCENRGENALNERKIWDFYQKNSIKSAYFQNVRKWKVEISTFTESAEKSS